MKKIIIECQDGKEVKHFYLDDLADLIAYAQYPEVDQDPDSMSYALAKIQAENELTAAVTGGELMMRNPLTHGPFDLRLGLGRGVVLWDEAVKLLAGYQIELVSGPPSAVEVSTPEKRQAKLWQACIDAGLKMPVDTYQHYPRGIGKLAESLGLTRQWLTQELDAHRERVFRK